MSLLPAPRFATQQSWVPCQVTLASLEVLGCVKTTAFAAVPGQPSAQDAGADGIDNPDDVSLRRTGFDVFGQVQHEPLVPTAGAVFEDLKQRLATWRKQTRDPLLDPANLERLKAEIDSLESKAASKKYRWGYPDYFFGTEASAKTPGKKRQGKQVQ